MLIQAARHLLMIINCPFDARTYGPPFFSLFFFFCGLDWVGGVRVVWLMGVVMPQLKVA